MMKLDVIYLFKKKRFQLRFKKINIRTTSDFKGELVPKKSGLYRKKKTLSKQRREPATNVTHTWRRCLLFGRRSHRSEVSALITAKWSKLGWRTFDMSKKD